jgi:hypothetical protein
LVAASLSLRTAERRPVGPVALASAALADRAVPVALAVLVAPVEQPERPLVVPAALAARQLESADSGPTEAPLAVPAAAVVWR